MKEDKFKGVPGLNVRPMGDRVAIAQADEEYEGKIHIPEGARDKSPWGIVVALGTGKPDFTFSVKVGDSVLLPRTWNTEIEFDGHKFIIVREGELLAVLDK